MNSRITTGIDYTFTLFLGAGVSWRPCLSESSNSYDAIPSLWLAKKSLQGHNTPVLRRCRSTSAANSASFPNSLGLRGRPISDAFLVLAFPRYCPEKTFGCLVQGFTDMSRCAPRNYSLGTQ
jgi:hypothetical protein